MTLSRASDPHGLPTHPVPDTDDASWRRFLEPAAVYHVSRNEEEERRRTSIHELLTTLGMAGRALADPDIDHRDGTTIATDPARGTALSLLHEQEGSREQRTVTLRIMRDGRLNQLSINVNRHHGCWSIETGDGKDEQSMLRERMTRIHAVFLAHLRHMEAQPHERLRQAVDAKLVQTIVQGHVLPEIHNAGIGQAMIDAATPWGGPRLSGAASDDASHRAARLLEATPLALGTRLAAMISRYDQTTSLHLTPVRTRADARDFDVMAMLRAVRRLETMPNLALAA